MKPVYKQVKIWPTDGDKVESSQRSVAAKQKQEKQNSVDAAAYNHTKITNTEKNKTIFFRTFQYMSSTAQTPPEAIFVLVSNTTISFFSFFFYFSIIFFLFFIFSNDYLSKCQE